MEKRKIKRLVGDALAINCNAYNLAVGKPPAIQDPTREAEALDLIAEYEPITAHRSAPNAEKATEKAKESD